MKKIGYFLLAAFLLIVLAGGMSCQSKTQYTTATPEGTVRAFLKAYSEMDGEKVAQLCVESQREKVRSYFGGLSKEFESITFSNIKIEVVDKNENTALVKVQFDVTTTIKEGFPSKTVRPKQEARLSLVKREGKWLIETKIVV